MDKYIGFDVDDKKTMACMVQSGCPDRYATLPTEVEAMRQWLVVEMRLAGVAYILNVIHLFVTRKLRSEKNIRLLSNFTIAYAILNTILGLALLFLYKINGILLGMIISNLLLLAYLVKTKNLSLHLKLDFKIIGRLIKIGFPILIIGMAIMEKMEKRKNS